MAGRLITQWKLQRNQSVYISERDVNPDTVRLEKLEAAIYF